MHEKLKDIIQDCHLNVLIGSGMSMPYLATLGPIEALLSALDSRDDISRNARRMARASLYRKYFESVVEKNLQILDASASAAGVLNEYSVFLKALASILLQRKVTILSKEANIFTTNIDIFLEKALDTLGLEYNDGFSGRFKPTFSLSNFKKSHYRRSLHYDHTSEIPVFNLCKLHGSLSWTVESDQVHFSTTLSHVSVINDLLSKAAVIPNADVNDIDELLTIVQGVLANSATRKFVDSYEKLLMIVNPSKEKFRHTVMNQTYYELLRLYSNELEKENTFLLVLGFSFADEHIREITLRAVNSNPTLVVYVVAHTGAAANEIEVRLQTASLRNKNIRVIRPDLDVSSGAAVDKFTYDFGAINEKIMAPILALIAGDEQATAKS